MMKKGFTLIELLIVLAIIGVLISISVFGTQGARESARDNRRKADLESMRTALEIYKADCNEYPPSDQFRPDLTGQSLNGDGSIPSCDITNIYMASIPNDPQQGVGSYWYQLQGTGTTYFLCAKLENVPSGGVLSCGNNCNGECNFRVDNP